MTKLSGESRILPMASDSHSQLNLRDKTSARRAATRQHGTGEAAR